MNRVSQRAQVAAKGFNRRRDAVYTREIDIRDHQYFHGQIAFIKNNLVFRGSLIQDQKPDHHKVDHGDKDGGTAYVFSALSESVVIQ